MKISIEEYKRRRNQVLQTMKNGILVIPSLPESTMSNDVNFVYRQNSDILYLCGFEEPNTTLVLKKGEDKNEFILFVPKRDKLFETWNGRREGTVGAKEKFFADEAFENSELKNKLSDWFTETECLYFPFKFNQSIDEVILNSISEAKRQRKLYPVEIINPLPIIHKMRAIKSSEEIELLKKGSKISIEAHLTAMKNTKNSKFEYEVEAYYDFTFKKYGSKRAAYPHIVGGGENATILHYITNDSKLNDGELLLVDAGCEYGNYATDITRTWPINGRFSDVQKEVYDIVLQVQNECIKMIKPGVSFQSLTDHAIKKITEGLIKLNLLEGEVKDNVKEKTYRRFFMHGLGHWMGIDVHDSPFYNLQDKTLEEGMVITVEPGIYIPVEDDIPERLRGIGIRIEDDIVVTKNGNVNLTAELPKTIEEIEKIME